MQCLHCGQELTSKWVRTSTKFCNVSCANAYIGKHRSSKFDGQICRQCGRVIKQRPGQKSTAKFCGQSCAAIYNNAHRPRDSWKITSTKKDICPTCGREHDVLSNATPGKTRCKSCNHVKKNTCKLCGQVKPCKRPDICRRHSIFSTLIKHFGMKPEVVGTLGLYEEVDRIKHVVQDKYDASSMSVICTSIGISMQSLFNVMRFLDIRALSISDGIRKAYKEGRGVHPPATCRNKGFKHGWHETWNGKSVFYRSSYELEYAEQLDAKQIDYEMEKPGISYWDSQKQQHRMAYPDFHLINEHKLVEITAKGSFYYDKQNMIDREAAYRKLGFSF